MNSEVPEVAQQSLEWGIHPREQLSLQASQICSCFSIDQVNFIGLSTSSVFLFQGQEIKETLDLALSSAVYVDDQNIVVGVSSGRSLFYVLNPAELGTVLAESIKTQQMGVFKMYYAKKSHILITIGNDVRFWEFSIEVAQNKLVKIGADCTFTLIATIPYDYEHNFLSPPVFDERNEILVLERNNAFLGYNTKGEFVRHYAKITSEGRMCCDFYPDEQWFMTADCINGVCIFNQYGIRIRHVLVGDSSVIYACFIDDEYVLVINDNLNTYIVDIMLNNKYFVFKVETKPNTILVRKNERHFNLYFCQKHYIQEYEVIVPFRTWVMSLPNAVRMKLEPKIGKAPRLVVQSDNAYVNLVSVKDRVKLTTASSQDSLGIKLFEYDRGMYENPERIQNDIDTMILSETNGNIDFFKTHDIPCPQIGQQKGQFVACSLLKVQNVPTYVGVSSYGDLVYFDRETLQSKKRVVIGCDTIRGAIGDKKFNTVLIFLYQTLIRFDIDTQNVIGELPVSPPNVVEIKDDLACLGYNNGKLILIKLTKNEMKFEVNEDDEYHHDVITGITFGNGYIVSVSNDCWVKLWTYHLIPMCRVKLPIPITSVAIVNGYRDIIVSTKQDLMIIPGKTLFRSPPEPEDPLLDNYCKLEDELYIVLRKQRGEIVDDESPTKAKKKRRRRVWDNMPLSAMEFTELEDNPSGEKKDKKGDDEMTEAEKAAALAEMSGMTDTYTRTPLEKSYTPPPPPPPEEPKPEEEEKAEEEIKEPEQSTEPEKQKKKKIKKKKKHSQKEEQPEEEDERPEKERKPQKRQRRNNNDLDLDGVDPYHKQQKNNEVEKPIREPPPRKAPEETSNVEEAPKEIKEPEEPNDSRRPSITQKSKPSANKVEIKAKPKPPKTKSKASSKNPSAYTSNKQLSNIYLDLPNTSEGARGPKPDNSSSGRSSRPLSEKKLQQIGKTFTTKDGKERTIIRKGNKIGYIDDDGNFIEGELDESGNFIEKRKPATKSKRIRRVNENGEVEYETDSDAEGDSSRNHAVLQGIDDSPGSRAGIRSNRSFGSTSSGRRQGSGLSGRSCFGANNFTSASERLANATANLVRGPNGELGFYDEKGRFIVCPGGKFARGPNGELGAYDEDGNFVPLPFSPPNLTRGPNGELGFYDASGRFIPVPDGKLVRGPNGELGVYDENGNFIVCPDLSKSKLVRGPNNEIGFYDENGNFIPVPGGKLVKGPNGQLGVYDENGNFIRFVPPNPLLIRGPNNILGFYDDNGNFIPVPNGRLVQGPNGEWGIYDENGNFIVNPQSRKFHFIRGPNEALGFYDANGEYHRVPNGEFVMNDKGQVGVYDENGQFVVCPGPTGVRLIRTEDGRVGFYDEKGRFVEVRGGKLSIGPGGQLGTYDERGRFIPCNDAKLIRQQNGDVGYYDEDGNFIILEMETNQGPVLNPYRIAPRPMSTAFPNREMMYNNDMFSKRMRFTRRAKSPPLRIYWKPDEIPPNVVLDKEVAIQRFLDGDLKFLQSIRNFQIEDGLTAIPMFDYIAKAKEELKHSPTNTYSLQRFRMPLTANESIRHYESIPNSARTPTIGRLIRSPIVTPRVSNDNIPYSSYSKRRRLASAPRSSRGIASISYSNNDVLTFVSKPVVQRFDPRMRSPLIIKRLIPSLPSPRS